MIIWVLSSQEQWDWCIQCILRLQREHGKTPSDFCRCNGVLVHPKMDSNNWRLFTASTLPCLLALKKKGLVYFFGFPPNQRGWSQQVFSAWLSPLVSTNRGERCNCLSVGSHKLQVEHCRTGLAIGSNGVGRAQKFKRIKVAVVFCHQKMGCWNPRFSSFGVYHPDHPALVFASESHWLWGVSSTMYEHCLHVI